MCGIAGLSLSEVSASELMERTNIMLTALAHRGPDDQGIMLVSGAKNLALGHRRLSILDLSKNGRQPMRSDSGRYVLTFNGEIYNFRELKAQLSDYPFSSLTDTEVLLASIEKWGVLQALAKIHGMFAFAVFDEENQSLTLVRDRFGEKPLYYCQVEGQLAFASELAALEQVLQSSFTLSPEGLSQFFQLGCIPSPYTIYNEVKKVRAGECVTFDAQHNWASTTQTYFTPKVKNDSRKEVSLEQLEDILQGVITRQLHADVPVGVFLSGGVDSAVIAAVAQRQAQKNAQTIKTFTVSFGEKQYNESLAAERVARKLQTDHYEISVTEQQVLDLVPEALRAYSEPFADSSQIPTYLICKEAKKHVSVCLSGDGGDEVFGGYNRYIYANRIYTINRYLPSSLQSIMRLVATLLAKRDNSLLGKHFSLVHDKCLRLSRLLGQKEMNQFYRELVGHLSNLEVLLQPEWISKTSMFSQLASLQAEELIAEDLAWYLSEDILTKVDRASMAVSLETRAPYLDHELVQRVLSTPIEQRVCGLTGKKLLKKLYAKYLPEEWLNQPKQGFSVPLSSWLRGPLRPWAEELIVKRQLQESGVFVSSQVEKIWQRFIGGEEQNKFLLWDILVFQNWYLNLRPKNLKDM